MTVRFYNAFSKRKNSTKKPANTDTHYDIDVVLKEDTTIERPSIVLTNREGTASGNPVTVSAMGGNMVSPVVTFNPVQSGSGTPSPSNPRPISAYGDIQVGVNGNITYIDIDGAKYGGTLDVSTGVLTLKYGFFTLDENSSLHTINTHGAYTRFHYQISGAKYPDANQISTYLPYLASYNNESNHFYITTNTAIFLIETTLVGTTAASIKSYLQNNNLSVCYELATYQTVQLTPAQIALAQGTNTITVNGNSTISFGYTAEEIATDYVYAYIPKWDKYYFVATPNILTNYHVQYDLEEDYLASRKTEVGSTVAHIAFSSSGYNKYIPDTRMCVRSDRVYQNAVSAASGLSSVGCYILSVINDTSNGLNGAATYYMLSTGDLAKLTKNLLDASVVTQIKNIFNDPMDCIVSCTWIPLTAAEMTGHLGTAEFVHLGNEELDGGGDPSMACAGSPVTDPIVELTPVSLTIPYKWNDFRDGQPYTSFSLYLPGLGETDLNANDFIESTTVSIYPRIDITTGDIIYWIYDDNGIVLKTVTFSGGCDVPLAHITTNAKGALATIGGSVGGLVTSALGAVTGNAPLTVGGGLALLGAAGSTAMQFNTRSTSIKGSTNGRSAFKDTTFKLTVCSQETEDPDNASYIARWGRPVATTHAISNHSGYVQCDNASVALAGDNTEREIINNYLNTGFFYE